MKLAYVFAFAFSAASLVACGSSGADDATSEGNADLTSQAICGGRRGLECPSGKTCIDDPNDGCDPKNGGADCGGICIAKPAPQICGGFGGLECPTGLTCIDDPNDGCDPKNGGADCGGICVE